MPFGYRGPASEAGNRRSEMWGICWAVNATTSTAGSSLYTVRKLKKSRPAAPMIRIRLTRSSPFAHRDVGAPAVAREDLPRPRDLLLLVDQQLLPLRQPPDRPGDGEQHR